MTYRQFFNCLVGFRNKQDAESKERLYIMRKVAYYSVLPYLKPNTREVDFMPFEFETNTVKKVEEIDYQQLCKEIEEVKNFYKKIDAAKKSMC